MIGIFIALVVLLGVGGTVTVADSARPGDTLFGIDQAVEKLRINIAREENKNELRIKFAEERVREIEDLVQDDDDDGAPVLTEISTEEQANVSVGIEVALNLLAGLKEQQGENPLLDDIVRKLNAYLIDFPSNTRIEVDNDKLQIKFEDDKSDDLKIKIKTDEGRIKIEVKDGVLEIKTKLDDDSSEDDNKAVGLEEVEAEILSDKTIIKVEFNDEETTFTTSATSREAIVAAIIVKFPDLTSAQVDAILKIETEDDDSDEVEELDKNESFDDDNQDDDSDDSDEDDDSGDDDDNSGSNSGDESD